MQAKNAELKAGIIVVAAAAALLGLLFFATGGTLWGNWRYVTLRVAPGSLAPKVGDPVRVLGVDVGKVDSVGLRAVERRGPELTPEDLEVLGHPDATEAERNTLSIREHYAVAVARIREDQQIPEGTVGQISEGITESRTLDLVPGPGPGLLTDDDTHGKPIPVKQAPGLESILGKVDKALDGVAKIVQDVRGVARAANDLLAEAQRAVADVRAKVNSAEITGAISDVSASAATLRKTLELVAGKVEQIASDISAATADVKHIGEAGARTADRLESDLRELLATLKDVGGKLDGIVERGGRSVDAFLLQMNTTAANLAALSADLRGLAPDARGLISDLGQDVDDMLRALTDTAHNLLDASEDIRAHPYKLLKEPSNDQIAFDNVRSAMQNYSRAMREMNEASGRLRETLASPGPLTPESRRRIEDALKEFEASRDRYQRMERRLMDLLQAAPPPGVGNR